MAPRIIIDIGTQPKGWEAGYPTPEPEVSAMRTVIIKGGIVDAKQAANRHGVVLSNARSYDRGENGTGPFDTVGVVADDDDSLNRLIRWFTSDRTPPFHNGSLLWYSEPQ